MTDGGVRCQRCGAPGSLHHFPGRSPTSGVWCDHHLVQLRWLHPLGDYGRWLWGASVVGLCAAIAILR